MDIAVFQPCTGYFIQVIFRREYRGLRLQADAGLDPTLTVAVIQLG